MTPPYVSIEGPMLTMVVITIENLKTRKHLHVHIIYNVHVHCIYTIYYIVIQQFNKLCKNIKFTIWPTVGLTHVLQLNMCANAVFP